MPHVEMISASERRRLHEQRSQVPDTECRYKPSGYRKPARAHRNKHTSLRSSPRARAVATRPGGGLGNSETCYQPARTITFGAANNYGAVTGVKTNNAPAVFSRDCRQPRTGLLFVACSPKNSDRGAVPIRWNDVSPVYLFSTAFPETRGTRLWYKIYMDGEKIRESTKHSNKTNRRANRSGAQDVSC